MIVSKQTREKEEKLKEDFLNMVEKLNEEHHGKILMKLTMFVIV